MIFRRRYDIIIPSELVWKGLLADDGISFSLPDEFAGRINKILRADGCGVETAIRRALKPKVNREDILEFYIPYVLELYGLRA